MRDSQGNLLTDRVLLVLLLVVMSISAVVTTIGNQRLEDTVHQTDIIAQCTDPKSNCARLQAESQKRNQEYLKALMKTTNICVVYANRESTGQPIDQLVAAYDRCVEAGAPPPPAPVTEGEVKK